MIKFLRCCRCKHSNSSTQPPQPKPTNSRRSTEQKIASTNKAPKKSLVKSKGPVIKVDPMKSVDEGLISASSAQKYFGMEALDNVPRLAHGLERVLFNPGPHFLRDPRTRLYNFDPYVRHITQPDEFQFDCLPPFVPPSKDKTLQRLAADMGCRFTGSTSSISGALSQLYFIVSGFRELSLNHLPAQFKESNSKFTKLTMLPSAITLMPRDNNVYSINYDHLGIAEKESIMMQQGKVLELFFVKSQEEYAKYLRTHANSLNPAQMEHSPETYVYCNYGNMLLRSQIDCQHPMLPRRSFDIKTRATLAIRMNSQNHQEFLDYRIDRVHGMWNSFTREYYDMMRSAFLKYSFQVRIGNMDGLFVAYHNTAEIFGFQYVSREELDMSLFGNTYFGDQAFRLSLGMMNVILNAVHSAWPGEYIRLILRANEKSRSISIYGERLKPDEVEKLDPEPPESSFKKWNLDIQYLLNGTLIENIPSQFLARDELDISYSLKEDTKVRAKECLVMRNSLVMKRSAHRGLKGDDTKASPFSNYIKSFFNPEEEDGNTIADLWTNY